jgi:hypothetical protein
MKRGVGHAVLPLEHFQFHARIREHFQLSVAVGSGDAGSEVHGECFTALVLATLEKRKNYKGDKNANSALDFAVG